MTERRYAVTTLALALHPDGGHAGRLGVAIHLGDRGEQYTATQLRDRVLALDPAQTLRVAIRGASAAVVAAWDVELATALRGAGYEVAVELDGTHALAAPVDWLVVAPHAIAPLADGLAVDEVKVVVDAAVTEDVLDRYAARWRCEHYFLVADAATRERATALIRARPRWRLSIPLA